MKKACILFCIQWFFVIELFWNVLYSFEFFVFPNIRLLLISLRWYFWDQIKILGNFHRQVFVTRILLIRIPCKFRTAKCWSTLHLHSYDNCLYFPPSFCAFHNQLIIAQEQLKISEIYSLFRPIGLQIFCILTKILTIKTNK